ncbi:response regulator [Aliidiomarina taiwanensis]|uniref:Response regulator n=1 Tax=Aliidiomarina taiwanensis TaxID=946228 RepID=A0A432X902_9GAMM|nr:response regulator [Aliidiomarina taiwanensis]RUO43905.1 response regulator [Aliidiomarina taiwanensis]
MGATYLFAEEPQQQELPEESWKILIVDDEPEVHAVTKLALSDFQFLGRGLEFHSAYSGMEACELAKAHPDAAIVLLDVVMETDDAGLNVARYIREELNNRYTRIILRTGQPGQAPERTVIVNYDINDYKSKTELTAQKLFTAVMSSLRSYRDIISIVQSRTGLEKIIASMNNLFVLQSMDQLISGVVQQLGWLIGGARQTIFATVDRSNRTEFKVRAAYGEDADQLAGQLLKSALPKEALVELAGVVKTHSTYYADDFVIAYCASESQPEGALLCLTGLVRPLNEREREMLQLFADNVQVALDNVLCLQDSNQLFSDLATRLVTLETEAYALHPEQRSLYVQTIDQMTALLELSGEERQHLGTAAGVYERIVSRFITPDGSMAERISPTQKRLIQAVRPLHASPHPVVNTAVQALEERLERFDGMGLPQGSEGEQVAFASYLFNITGLFIELVKQDLPLEDVVARLREEQGNYLNPALCELIIEHAHSLYQFVLEHE